MKNSIKSFLVILVLISLSCVSPRLYPVLGWPLMFFRGLIGGMVFIGLVVALIYLLIDREKLIKKIGREEPLDILKKRYARGEITKKEFDMMKAELK